MGGKTMQAWQYSSVQGKLEDCLSIQNVPIPDSSSLHKGEVLLEVIAVSLNPVDYKLPEFGFLGRLMIPRPASPGLDFCGRVVASHPSVTEFKTGQLVFGGLPAAKQMGTLAQYTIVPAGSCALLPESVDPEQAAAAGTAATTAYQSLLPDSTKPGAKVFINGGSGGVGTWAIQLARALEAEVTTTCSTGNVELCRQLGAAEVIDYKKEDIIAALKTKGKTFDLVIDNVGHPALYNACTASLKPGGAFVQVGVGEGITFAGMVSNFTRQLWPLFRAGPRFHFINMRNAADVFSRIGQWMAEGKVKAVIDTAYAWEDAPAAFRKLREGHAKGKIVVRVSRQSQ